MAVGLNFCILSYYLYLGQKKEINFMMTFFCFVWNSICLDAHILHICHPFVFTLFIISSVLNLFTKFIYDKLSE